MLFKIINRGVEHVFKILSEIISEIKFEFFNMGVKGRNFFPRSDFCSLYLERVSIHIFALHWHYTTPALGDVMT